MTTTNSSLGVTGDMSPTASTNDFDDMASSGKLKIYRKLSAYVRVFTHHLIISTNEQTEERNAAFLSLYFLYLYFLFSCLLCQLFAKENVRSNEGRRTHT
jgi:hypothetical protein